MTAHERGNPARTGASAEAGTVTVEEPRWAYAAIAVVFPAVGALLGWGLPALAEWWVTLPWAPLAGPAELVASLPDPWVLVAPVAAGAIAGLVMAGIAWHERSQVQFGATTVEVQAGGHTDTVDRAEVAGAFVDGKQLVVLGTDTAELVRRTTDLSERKLRDAFTAHGFRWHDGDPHADEFRRWVPDLPGLPTGAEALLAARQRALEGKDADEVEVLRRELVRLRVAVRDEKHRQYIRVPS
ncbi:hypothetical protein BJF85_22650 [Saccharomonospora sp. CUA-673]|uniref:YqeB family protein n=1 Tax=Saccharomonospora sp. CUA-673 TaxID=1904969 RepID=UPI000964B8CD|nr:hypothetical protein [Saccharomonospora sp. CUA-673]OLT42524.1 hypothetical protein BJF85_22650 [Saccharomonospora sp. CUA-673]